MFTISDDDFEFLTTYLKQNFGINLTQKRSLIECRLSSMIEKMGLSSLSEYLKLVFSDTTGEQMSKLLCKLTTNHTYFMRENDHFDFFKKVVIPELLKTNENKDFRIWSAGCSTGEESYTLAMIIDGILGDLKILWNTKILATDISVRTLDLAKSGIYSKEALQSLPQSWKMNYFEMIEKDLYQIKDALKKEVIYRVFNLMEETFPFKKKFDVIFCRNVMIYFDYEDKMKLIEKFYEHTKVGGYLFIGHSESIRRNESDYKYVMPSVYRKG